MFCASRARWTAAPATETGRAIKFRFRALNAGSPSPDGKAGRGGIHSHLRPAQIDRDFVQIGKASRMHDNGVARNFEYVAEAGAERVSQLLRVCGQVFLKKGKHGGSLSDRIGSLAA